MKSKDCSKASDSGQDEGLARLRAPLRLELKQGCLDLAVSGGLEPFVQRFGSGSGLAALLAGYAAMPLASRLKAVEEALSLLSKTGAPPSASQKVPSIDPASLAFSASRLLPGASLTAVPGLGPKRAAALRSLGLETVQDLLYHLPRHWQDRSAMRPIAELIEGEVCTVQGVVLSSVSFRTRTRLTITEVAVSDGSGSLSAMYFNQPFQQKRFKQGETVVLSGRAEKRGRQMQMSNPEAEVLPPDGEGLVHTGRIVPLYPLAKEVSQRVFRSAIWCALDACESLEDPLPPVLRQSQGLAELGVSLRTLHFPPSFQALESAKRRLIFDEFFLLGLALELRKRREQAEKAPMFRPAQGLAARVLKALPFALTKAQERVWRELSSDLESGHPMRRLLQGDVGSGKTVLAALAVAAAVSEGWQAAVMAPTEILADQHLRNFKAWLEPLGVEVLRLTQGQKAGTRREVLAHLSSAQPLVVVGTQALIQTGVEFGRLGLAVIDEQHRFGVAQRLTLSKKSKLSPHILVMTATPIPRTLAMTAYGDLDLSVLDELPPGRSPIRTRVLKPAKRAEAFEAVRAEVAAGRQAYIVYALVDESDKAEWQAATKMIDHLQGAVFPELKMALLHGRMKPEEKDAVMQAFKAGDVQVLCSTTVVEVGVDVPNATVMVIEDADRFGLAQLHQLRGRVGRGAVASACYLIGEPKTEEGRQRLKVMAATQDGFVIAEEDLKLRGPGELLGLRQSGLPELKLADLLRDHALLSQARQASRELMARDPELSQKDHQRLKRVMLSRYSTKVELARVG